MIGIVCLYVSKSSTVKQSQVRVAATGQANLYTLEDRMRGSHKISARGRKKMDLLLLTPQLITATGVAAFSSEIIDCLSVSSATKVAQFVHRGRV